MRNTERRRSVLPWGVVLALLSSPPVADAATEEVVLAETALAHVESLHEMTSGASVADLARMIAEATHHAEEIESRLERAVALGRNESVTRLQQAVAQLHLHAAQFHALVPDFQAMRDHVERAESIDPKLFEVAGRTLVVGVSSMPTGADVPAEYARASAQDLKRTLLTANRSRGRLQITVRDYRPEQIRGLRLEPIDGTDGRLADRQLREANQQIERAADAGAFRLLVRVPPGHYRLTLPGGRLVLGTARVRAGHRTTELFASPYVFSVQLGKKARKAGLILRREGTVEIDPAWMPYGTYSIEVQKSLKHPPPARITFSPEPAPGESFLEVYAEPDGSWRVAVPPGNVFRLELRG